MFKSLATHRIISVLQKELKSSKTQQQIKKYENIQSIIQRIFQGQRVKFSHSDQKLFINYLMSDDELLKVVNIVECKIINVFERQFKNLNQRNYSKFGKIFGKLAILIKNIQRFADIFFMLDFKFYSKHTNTSLKQFTSEVFSKNLLQNKKMRTRLLEEFIKHIFKTRGKPSNSKFLNFLEILLTGCNQLQKQTFSDLFAYHYVPKLTAHYNPQIQVYKLSGVITYCQIFLKRHKSEKMFLRNGLFFLKKRNINDILLHHYKIWIDHQEKYIFASYTALIPFENDIVRKVIRMYPYFQNKFQIWYRENLQKYLGSLQIPASTCNILNYTNLYNLFFKVVKENIGNNKLFCEQWFCQPKFNILNRLVQSIHQYLDPAQVYLNLDNTIFSRFAILFKFVQDKQNFELLYRKLLVKRLTTVFQNKTPFQQLLITVFINECGNEMTKNMQIILRQYQVYKFNELNVLIFKQQSWPWINKPKDYQVNMAPKLKFYLQNSKVYLESIYKNKYIKWDPIFGEGYIQIKLEQGNLLVRVSTVIMNFLLYFNEKTSFTLQQFINYSNYNINQLIPNLFQLLKSKIILTQQNIQNICDITPHMNLYLLKNIDSNNRFINFTFQHAVQKTKQEQKQLTQQKMAVLQGVTIKILKHKKEIANDILYESVQQMIHEKGYKMEKELYNKSIKNLVIKGFIEQESDHYVYVP